MLTPWKVKYLDRYFKPVPHKVPNSGSIILLDREVQRETDKAYLVYIRHEPRWLPKSMCYANDRGQIAIPRWLIRTEEEAKADTRRFKKKPNQRQQRILAEVPIRSNTDLDALNRRLLRLEAAHIELLRDRMGLAFDDDYDDTEEELYQ